MATATLEQAPPSWISRIPLRELGMIPAIAVAVLIGAIVSPVFLSTQNLVNILQQSAELSIVVIAQALIVICAKFDLSQESIVGFAPMLAAWLVVPATIGGAGLDIHPLVGIAIMFAVGAVIGAVNGLLVVKLGLNAFIATLAMLILLRGATLGIANGRTLSNLPTEFTFLGSTSALGIPLSVWIAGVLFVVATLFTRYHRLGRSLYVIGGNAHAAKAGGIRVDRVVIGVYVVGGLLAALAGLLFMGRLGAVTANQGQNMIFTVMAAIVIGGISLNGGRGTMFGALTGVLLLGVISNILTLSAISSFWIQASQGAIILAALIFQRMAGGERDDT
ncbi:ABC transporter permease [Microbacterium lacticum]|uniref:ABC transporter permease n=1 Tax=Microbacterium lacticum TaxID=33885 RepID=UPI003A8C759E